MAESFRITDHNSLNEIRTKVFQHRDKAKCDYRTIHALDTETGQNGDILVICDEMGNYLDKITPESLFSWLFSKRYQGTWNFFYFLDFDGLTGLGLVTFCVSLFFSCLSRFRKETASLIFNPFNSSNSELILSRFIVTITHHTKRRWS